jgi:adenylate cyclase
MTSTLMETYLGRDAGRRVLGGKIVRGLAEEIDAVVWFSDLAGFTRITDTTPEQVIPLLNDYSDAIVSAIHEHGGDVLKLIGDGTLAIFAAQDRAHACDAALTAALAARRKVAETKQQAGGRGQTGDRHVSRPARRQGLLWQCRQSRAARLHRHRAGGERGEPIAAMCRSIDQPVLVSATFAAVGDMKRRLLSVGRYALRGVSHPQELFTLDPEV